MTPATSSAVEGKLPRRAAILRFLFRYRKSGVFNGLSLEPTMLDEGGDDDGSPEQFADELEALGPTFVKLGQMLSTRPDLVPPAYASALERMQEDVTPVPFDVIREQVEDALRAVSVAATHRGALSTRLGAASERRWDCSSTMRAGLPSWTTSSCQLPRQGRFRLTRVFVRRPMKRTDVQPERLDAPFGCCDRGD